MGTVAHLGNQSALKHGYAAGPKPARVYHVWHSMLQRCSNPNGQQWERYGGRGITVCERWHDLLNFIADMGEPPERLSIERINNDGNYEPGNCKWATKSEQRRNQRPRPKQQFCKRGHELAGENIILYRGERFCRICHKIRQQSYKIAAMANG